MRPERLVPPKRFAQNDLLPSLPEVLPQIEILLDQKKPVGIIYLDIARYGHLESNYGHETFDEIFLITSELLQSFSGKLFRREDMILISEDFGDVFIVVLSSQRSRDEITDDVLSGISSQIQEALNQGIKDHFGGLIRPKIGYFAGHAILYPEIRVNRQRQIYRAVKEASRMSLGQEQNAFERKVTKLRAIIRANELTAYFHPIVRFNPQTLIGHELLTRGPGGNLMVDSEMMFEVAQRGGLILELERAARRRAIETLTKHPPPGKIFINNGPQVIMSPEFSDFLIYEHLGLDPNRVVIEITEGEAIKNVKGVRKRLEVFRRLGCQIAIDDVGKGNSGLYLLAELQPDYAKVDMTLIRGIDKDKLKQGLMEKLIEFGRMSGTCFIAEGIETTEEFEALKRLGVEVGQGFLFGMPNIVPQIPQGFSVLAPVPLKEK